MDLPAVGLESGLVLGRQDLPPVHSKEVEVLQTVVHSLQLDGQS